MTCRINRSADDTELFRTMDVPHYTRILPAEDEPIFDKDEFVRRNLGDLELSRDVAAVFIQHGPEYLREIYDAFSAGDREALCQSAHKLKGAAVNLALMRLSSSAASIEAAAKTKSVELTATLVTDLNNVYYQAVHAIEVWVGTER
ncbi:MAG: Hpt domain-containing protein [Desulfuromonadaceae bacterium]|nr:Hpt domain-containing protein [Desulfuromonadaceae bacterium]